MKRLVAAAAATSNAASKKPEEEEEEEEEEEDEEKDYSSQVIWRSPPRASLNALWVNIVWKHWRVKRNVDSMVKSDFS